MSKSLKAVPAGPSRDLSQSIACVELNAWHVASLARLARCIAWDYESEGEMERYPEIISDLGFQLKSIFEAATKIANELSELGAEAYTLESREAA